MTIERTTGWLRGRAVATTLVFGLGLFAALLVAPSPIAAEACDGVRDGAVLTLDGKRRSFRALIDLETPTLVLSWSAYDPRSRRAIREFDGWMLDQADDGARVPAFALASLEYSEPPSSVAEVVRKSRVAIPVVVDGRDAIARQLAECAGRRSSLPAVFAVRRDGASVSVELVLSGWNERSVPRLRAWTSAATDRNESQEDDR